jgi:hypothetical protein
MSNKLSCYLEYLYILIFLLINTVYLNSQTFYVNHKNGFQLTYDSSQYKFHEYGPDIVNFYRPKDFLLNVEVVHIERNPLWIAVNHLLFPANATECDSLFICGVHESCLYCDSDGDDGWTRCDTIVDVSRFHTHNGYSAMKFYRVLTEYRGSETKNVIAPSYVVNISTPGQPRALIFDFNIALNPTQEYKNIMLSIMESTLLIQ